MHNTYLHEDEVCLHMGVEVRQQKLCNTGEYVAYKQEIDMEESVSTISLN